MAKFEYKALNAKGNEQSGTIEAANGREAISLLRGQGFFPTRVRLIDGVEENVVEAEVEIDLHSTAQPTRPFLDKNLMFPKGDFKCKLKDGIRIVTGYLNILGQEGGTWLLFQGGENPYGGVDDVAINLNNIREVRIGGIFRKKMSVYTNDGRIVEFVGWIGRITNIIRFEIAQRKK